MENILKKDSLKEKILLFFLSLSFLYGVLSYQHYNPSSHDFYINSIVFSLCSFGLFIYFFKKNIKIYVNSLVWVFLGLIFLVQPLINKIIYVDGLVFPIAETFLVLMLSIAISNIENKESFVKKLSVILFVTAILLFLTQISHVLKIMPIIEIMRLPLQKQRFSGNLFQPNQTAFIFVVGVISVLYFFNYFKKYNIVKCLLVLTLSIGVALTVSRSGLIILVCSVLIFNLYSNYYENKKIYYLKDLAFSISGLLLGFFLYNKYSISENAIERIGRSIDDPRLSLMHQSWLIITEHPITGIGWKNFASGGFQHFDQMEWISLSDHSHFIFGQLLSEFGLLGLSLILVFFYIFIKNLLCISNLKEAYLCSVLLVFIAYSCFEYPLWYLRYLFIFSIFFSLFDKSGRFLYKIEKGYLLSIIALSLTFSSIYYAYQYNKLAYINDVVFDSKYSLRERTEKLTEMRSVFGFSYFNDLLLYQTMEVDGFLLQDQILIGERLVNYIPMNQYLIKQGTLLAFDNQNEKSLYYFKASCHYDFGQNCGNTKEYLKAFAKQYPEYFNNIYVKVDTDF